ncbi:putative glutathione S-transferase [Tieghemostelium lacteum]|uniref:Putative glutathione S-transferase n=1 Tax=Tieghemostelium lacteum TaxID=361077 RepID=A0A151ZJ27_TIELA|nr:putative glutathione S-transferase [Tieghemostelium lacteum]|eukprot:KYQ93854.1 putative glutathione S-transferase [Tieghemostelium lacteum]
MSQPELIYFAGKGKGQFVRNVLTYCKVDFKDTRMEKADEALRLLSPYKQFPFYREGDFILAQSMVIARYIAEQHNFAGKTPKERALAGEVVESTQDILLNFFLSKDNEEKLKKYNEETVPTFFSSWETKLVNGKGFAAQGDSYTYADLSIFTVIDQLKLQDKLKSYPNVEKLFNHFLNHEIIGPYYKSLPITPF